MKTDIENNNAENQEETKEEPIDNEPEVKGEKKIKKALLKLGLTKIENINRVTVKQKDSYFFIVKDPEVYVSKESESSYIIFGELSMDDPDKPKGKEEFNNLKAQGEKINTTGVEKTPLFDVVEDNDDTPESEEGVEKDSIDMVIAEAKCSRQKAIRALKKNNNDVVGAILELNN